MWSKQARFWSKRVRPGRLRPEPSLTEAKVGRFGPNSGRDEHRLVDPNPRSVESSPKLAEPSSSVFGLDRDPVADTPQFLKANRSNPNMASKDRLTPGDTKHTSIVAIAGRFA